MPQNDRAKKKADHVIMSTIWEGCLVCFHCGETYRVNYPVPLDIIAAIAKTWSASHRGCTLSPRGAELREDHDRAYQEFLEKKERGSEVQNKLLQTDDTKTSGSLPGALDAGAVGVEEAHQQAPKA